MRKGSRRRDRDEHMEHEYRLGTRNTQAVSCNIRKVRTFNEHFFSLQPSLTLLTEKCAV